MTTEEQLAVLSAQTAENGKKIDQLVKVVSGSNGHSLVTRVALLENIVNKRWTMVLAILPGIIAVALHFIGK